MKKLPGSSGCYVCGRENPYSLKLEFYVDSSGAVISEFSLPEEYAGYPGRVHGGNIVAILDEIAGRALTTDDPNRFMVTSELKVKYLHPVPTNTKLTAIGIKIKQRGRVAVGHGEIKDSSGQVLAFCDAFYVDVSEQLTAGMNMESSGWRVYPDD
jgi:uncharacterized protein (TIGR00369 family)